MGEPRGHISRGQQIRRTEEWRRACATLKATRPWWCTYPRCDCPTGRAISPHARPRSRWSWTADHIIELEDGGAPYDQANLTPMHLRCNARKGRARQHARKQEALSTRARANEHHAQRSTTTPSRGGGSNHGQQPPTKTPESWSSLSEIRSEGAVWCPRAS